MNDTEVVDWIDVKTRVPDDRREVMAWGSRSLGWGPGGRTLFLGFTRFNPSPRGGRFDAEVRLGYDPYITRVTHWAEALVGPKPHWKLPPKEVP